MPVVKATMTISRSGWGGGGQQANSLRISSSVRKRSRPGSSFNFLVTPVLIHFQNLKGGFGFANIPPTRLQSNRPDENPQGEQFSQKRLNYRYIGSNMVRKNRHIGHNLWILEN
jgi:hypothetical protein